MIETFALRNAASKRLNHDRLGYMAYHRLNEGQESIVQLVKDQATWIEKSMTDLVIRQKPSSMRIVEYSQPISSRQILSF